MFADSQSGIQTRLLAAKAQGSDVIHLTIVLLCEMHISGVYAHETRVREMHAYEVHAYETHAHEVHAHEVHANEMHAYETHA